MLRRLFIAFITLCYFSVLAYTYLHVIQLPSSLRVISASAFNKNIQSFSVDFTRPVVSTGKAVYFFSTLNDSVFACNIHPFSGSFHSFFIPYRDVRILGCAADPGKVSFLVKMMNDTSYFYKILMIEGDTLFRMYDITLPDLPILFFQLHNNHMYFAFYQADTKPYVKLYTYNIQQRVTAEKKITFNQFFLRISMPFAVHYDNGSWLFFAVSKYYRKDNLYVKTSADELNIMTFRSNLSFHYGDQILQDTAFDVRCVDYAFAGVFSDVLHCSRLYEYVQQTRSFNVRHLPVLKDHQHYRVAYTIHGDAMSSLFLLFSGDTLTFSEHSILRRYLSGKSVYLNLNNEKPFARSYSDADYMLIPVQGGYIFLLEDGQYCLLSDSLERMDQQSRVSKFQELLKWQLHKLLSEKDNMQFWTLPVMLVGYPLVTLFAFLTYLMKLIFFTPQKTHFTLRRKRKVYFSSYWLPFLLLWFLAALLSAPAFINLLMTF